MLEKLQRQFQRKVCKQRAALVAASRAGGGLLPLAVGCHCRLLLVLPALQRVCLKRDAHLVFAQVAACRGVPRARAPMWCQHCRTTVWHSLARLGSTSTGPLLVLKLKREALEVPAAQSLGGSYLTSRSPARSAAQHATGPNFRRAREQLILSPHSAPLTSNCQDGCAQVPDSAACVPCAGRRR